MKLEKTKLLLLIALFGVFVFAACSGSGKDDPMNGKKIVCDSVKESFFDPNGVEQITTTYRCDTVIDNETK